MIDLTLKQQIVADCRKRAPEEACGFIVDGVLMPCKNRHPDPKNHFAIAAEDYALAEEQGDIECVYHSHSNGNAQFSVHDVQVCKQTNLPWFLYEPKTSTCVYADPTGNAPYVGRDWAYGIQDCYSLLRDFYRREFGIRLDDFERGENGEWERGGWTMFVDNYESQGFVKIQGPERKGDFLLMQIDAGSPNHAGVMAGEGNVFYHHLMDRQSQTSVWGNYWAKRTVYVLRHRDLL